MNYYDKTLKDVGNNTFTKVTFSLLFISLILFFYSRCCIFLAPFSKWFILVFVNCIADITIHVCIGCLWGHGSMTKLNIVKKNKSDSDKSKIDLNELREASWQPRIIGIIERIIMTVSFITYQYELAGGWMVLKVVRIHQKFQENKQKNSLWRVTENIFLIGTGLSIIFSLIATSLYFWI